LLFCAIRPLVLRPGETFLELDGTAIHGLAGMCIPVYAARLREAERAELSGKLFLARAISNTRLILCPSCMKAGTHLQPIY
jgi:hypothetical protein